MLAILDFFKGLSIKNIMMIVAALLAFAAVFYAIHSYNSLVEDNATLSKNLAAETSRAKQFESNYKIASMVAAENASYAQSLVRQASAIRELSNRIEKNTQVIYVKNAKVNEATKNLKDHKVSSRTVEALRLMDEDE